MSWKVRLAVLLGVVMWTGTGCEDVVDGLPAPEGTPQNEDVGDDAGVPVQTDSGGPPTQAPAPEATLSPSQGGTAGVELQGDDSVAVEVPAGAVNEDVVIEVAPVVAEELPALQGGDDTALVSESVAFTPHGTTFEQPVTISFTIEGGVPEGAMILRLDDELDTEWERMDASISGSVISAQVTSFSIYVVATGSVCHQDDPDSDGDGACDSADPCAAPDDDSDGDGVCDSVDPCDAPDDDADGDGVCDSVDPCVAPDDDSDGDGVCDSVDPCEAPDDDADGDGVCDSVDPCVAPDDDSDGDGVCDSVDPCEAPDDDTDGDGVCDSVDPCEAPDDDTDGDGVCDSVDPCAAPDDDTDGDGVCDSVDPCMAPSDDLDGNGVCDDTEGRIQGTVTDAGGQGAALAGVTVTLYDDQQATAGTTTTGNDGSYFFGDLAAGSYVAVVSESETCKYGSSEETTVAVGELKTADITAGCF